MIDNLTGKFHSHITLTCSFEEAETARELVGGKVTIIELERSQREQVDVMLTHYFLVKEESSINSVSDIIDRLKRHSILLGGYDINTVRIKLEHEILDDLSNPSQVQESIDCAEYTEVHIKCEVNNELLDVLKSTASDFGWHPSKNPLQQGREKSVQFINCRFYGDISIQSIQETIDTIVAEIENICTVIEVKVESAIFDDNGELDRWWVE